MPTPRVLMSKIRQALQLLAGDAGLSLRQVAAALGVSKTTISEIALYARDAGVDWPLAQHAERRRTAGPAVPAAAPAYVARLLAAIERGEHTETSVLTRMMRTSMHFFNCSSALSKVAPSDSETNGAEPVCLRITPACSSAYVLRLVSPGAAPVLTLRTSA